MIATRDPFTDAPADHSREIAGYREELATARRLLRQTEAERDDARVALDGYQRRALEAEAMLGELRGYVERLSKTLRGPTGAILRKRVDDPG